MFKYILLVTTTFPFVTILKLNSYTERSIFICYLAIVIVANYFICICEAGSLGKARVGSICVPYAKRDEYSSTARVHFKRSTLLYCSSNGPAAYIRINLQSRATTLCTYIILYERHMTCFKKIFHCAIRLYGFFYDYIREDGDHNILGVTTSRETEIKPFAFRYHPAKYLLSRAFHGSIKATNADDLLILVLFYEVYIS